MRNLSKYVVISLVEGASDMMTEPQKKRLLDLINSGKLTAKDATDMINAALYNNHMGYNTGLKKQIEDGIYATTVKKNGEIVHRKGDVKYKTVDIIDDDDYGVNEKLNSLDIPEATQKLITSRLISSDMMDRYIKYISGKGPQVSASDIVSGSNIFNILKKTNININTLKEISKMTTQNKNVSQGKYEILLKMFLSDYDVDKHTITSDGHKGDIVAGDIAFELKTNGGRIAGQSQMDIRKMQDVLKRKAPGIPKNPLNTDTDIRNTITELFSIYSDSDVCDIIAKAIGVLYPTSDITPKAYSSFLLNHVKEFKNDPKSLRRCIGVRQIIEYQYSENWNYMMVIDTESGNYILIDEKDANIKNGISALETLYKDNRFGFGLKGFNTGDAYSKAMQIKYGK